VPRGRILPVPTVGCPAAVTTSLIASHVVVSSHVLLGHRFGNSCYLLCHYFGEFPQVGDQRVVNATVHIVAAPVATLASREYWCVSNDLEGPLKIMFPTSYSFASPTSLVVRWAVSTCPVPHRCRPVRVHILPRMLHALTRSISYPSKWQWVSVCGS
jgi:hypothetical protein